MRKRLERAGGAEEREIRTAAGTLARFLSRSVPRGRNHYGRAGDGGEESPWRSISSGSVTLGVRSALLRALRALYRRLRDASRKPLLSSGRLGAAPSKTLHNPEVLQEKPGVQRGPAPRRGTPFQGSTRKNRLAPPSGPARSSPRSIACAQPISPVRQSRRGSLRASGG